MLLHNCFAYHFTPAGMMLESGARALGCPVFPAGPGNTEAQARAAAHLRPACYAGTPEYLKAILETGEALGLDLSSFGSATSPAAPTCRRCGPSSGPWPDRAAKLRHRRSRLIAYETEAREGLILRKASSSKSSAPAPATRCRKARWGRCWSRCSTRPTR